MNARTRANANDNVPLTGPLTDATQYKQFYCVSNNKKTSIDQFLLKIYARGQVSPPGIHFLVKVGKFGVPYVRIFMELCRQSNLC